MTNVRMGGWEVSRHGSSLNALECMSLGHTFSADLTLKADHMLKTRGICRVQGGRMRVRVDILYTGRDITLM